jgi:hypothetical protein
MTLALERPNRAHGAAGAEGADGISDTNDAAASQVESLASAGAVTHLGQWVPKRQLRRLVQDRRLRWLTAIERIWEERHWREIADRRADGDWN